MQSKNNSTTTLQVVCAFLFLIFSFCYVYFLQADFLTLVQHSWSGGKTHFNPLVGASLISVVLLILQRFVNAISSLPKSAKALTYFPSFLALAIITSGKESAKGTISLGYWWWIALIAIAVFFLLCSILSELKIMENKITRFGLFSQAGWINLSLMALMMFMTLCIGNRDVSLHQSVRMERLIAEKKYEKAITLCNELESPDSSAIMMRAFALSKKGELGERFFNGKITGTSQSLVPQGDKSATFRFTNSEKIWRYLGGIPRTQEVDAVKYLNKLKRQGMARKPVEDYLLTAYLIDKDLTSFAKEISNAGLDTIGNSLPRHYKEAITLYNNTHSATPLAFNDDSYAADYQKFITLFRDKKKAKAQRLKDLKALYLKSYWYYYYN